jgi:hypothetical protein
MSKTAEFDDKKHIVSRVALRNSADDDAATKMLHRNRPNHLAAARGRRRTPDGGSVSAVFFYPPRLSPPAPPWPWDGLDLAATDLSQLSLVVSISLDDGDDDNSTALPCAYSRAVNLSL